MYPRLLVDSEKIKINTQRIVEMAAAENIEVDAVTKVYCGDPVIAKASLEGGAKRLADSRLENFEKMADLSAEKVLLRLPMISEAKKVVCLADISLNSEIETVRALGKEASLQDKIHRVILMVDLGDLREGVLPKDAVETAQEFADVDGIELYGIGVNLTCYGGVIPDEGNLGQLTDIARHIEQKLGVGLEIVSGGNSSSVYLLGQGLPSKINHLRVGEAIVLGRETKDGARIEGTHDDAFILEAEIVEVKEKDSLPKGNIGMDAFGNKPVFLDKGKMIRAIAAIGRQDVIPDNLIPMDEAIEIIGASSDHMILDVTNSKGGYAIGDIVRFKLEYGALLALCSSDYVDKVKV